MVSFTPSSSGKMGGCGAFRSSALLFVLLELSLVCGDITDGNAEHLKREHSLTKPYQGRTLSPGANPLSASSIQDRVTDASAAPMDWRRLRGSFTFSSVIPECLRVLKLVYRIQCWRLRLKMLEHPRREKIKNTQKCNYSKGNTHTPRETGSPSKETKWKNMTHHSVINKPETFTWTMCTFLCAVQSST